MATETSPNVANLQVGKGIVTFMPEGEVTYRDLGNVTSFRITPSAETLEHFSSREGIRKRDVLIVIEQRMSVTMVMEEFTAKNLSLMVYGSVDEAAVGGPEVEIFGVSAKKGALRFVGTNDYGPKITVDLYNVSWTPSGDLEMITDEWNNREVEGEVLAAESGPNAGKFGLMQITNSTPS